ncbi:MAG: GIY-YIG nuclease family protein [Schlesneria sp.]
MTSEDATIIKCYESARGGYSADRVVVDPELNQLFLQNCFEAGLREAPANLNRKLLNIRKKGLLPRSERTKATSFSDEDDYRFASEIAVRIIQRRDGHSLDTILSDPELCRKLDELAKEIAPGYTPLRYRWAALNLRKAKRLSPEILGRVIQSETVLSFRMAGLTHASIPSEQGLYIFYDPPQTLYVGEASNLRIRLKKHFDHSDNRELAHWLWEHGAESVLLEIHVLPADTPTNYRRALETELIRSRNPLFNVQR